MRILHAMVVCALLVAAAPAYAGGPLFIGSARLGHDGQPLTWNPAAMPIPYRVDSGPLSVTPNGTVAINNSTGVTRVSSMFSVWSAPTANITFANGGSLLRSGAFSGGDAATVSDFDALTASCDNVEQNPIIFDADGSLFAALVGDPSVIGFAGACQVQGGYISSAMAVLNGIFQDGVDTGTNYELTLAEFDQAFSHEFGHFIGLDHSQINVSVLASQTCASDVNAGLPLMFPVLICPARISSGLPALAPDDKAWVSRLYPGASFATQYGKITGRIYYSDGKTQMQGINVIAMKANDQTREAYSAVSGQAFTTVPGQTVTPIPSSSDFGSHDRTLIGYYEIPVLPGAYVVKAESISPYFVYGSSVGPFAVPMVLQGPSEFWNVAESATDNPFASDTVNVNAGQTVQGIDIIINATPATFDDAESPTAEDIPPEALFGEEGRLA